MSHFISNIRKFILRALIVFFFLYFVIFLTADLYESNDFSLYKVAVCRGKEGCPGYFKGGAKVPVISVFSLTTSYMNLSSKNEELIYIRFATHKLNWFETLAKEVKYYLKKMSHHR
ncbi:hypothetical protein XB02_15710 [Pantoea ananatis]|nr:hypothetical protein XB02_15710 [Pantoea ananatis]